MRGIVGGEKMRKRRFLVVLTALFGALGWVVVNPASYEAIFTKVENDGAEVALVGGAENDAVEAGGDLTAQDESSENLATEILEKLEVKGRAPKTGYARTEFYNDWPTVEGCSLRQRIIKREFGETAVLDGCDVTAGEYDEPYTGEHKVFTMKTEISKGVQIDHVVALSDAWQKGAQYMTADVRYNIATDPLNLLAVDASTNQGKSDGDAATWLPPNKKFRCQYVARQISVKYKYGLWVTEAERGAMREVLSSCPDEGVVGV